MKRLITELTDKDDKKAYAKTKEIAAESKLSSNCSNSLGL